MTYRYTSEAGGRGEQVRYEFRQLSYIGMRSSFTCGLMSRLEGLSVWILFTYQSGCHREWNLDWVVSTCSTNCIRQGRQS